MITISVQVEGDKALLNKLRRFKVDLGDFAREMDHLGRYFVRFFGQDVFVTEGDVFGEGWPELSPPYEFYKRKKYAGRGILERTGKLRRGYKMHSDRDFVTIFNPVEYAKYHQSGTSRLPKRTLVKIDSERKRYIVDTLRDSVAQKVKKTFK